MFISSPAERVTTPTGLNAHTMFFEFFSIKAAENLKVPKPYYSREKVCQDISESDRSSTRFVKTKNKRHRGRGSI